ncbi:MAG: hypothetical protein DRP93_08270, partial [Candidatus Neomarinimicrobiota bacterium]
GTAYMITTNTDAEVELMKAYMQNLYLVWWNASYDLGTLMFKATPKTDDLWVAFKIAYPSVQTFTLDNCVEYLGYNDLYAGLDKKGLQKAGFVRNAYLSQQQLRYAAADVEALERMWNLPKIQKVRENNLAYRLAIYAIEETMVFQQNGLPIKQNVVEDYIVTTTDKLTAITKEVDALCGKGLNPRSPKQVKELLGTDSSDKATLTRIALEGSLDAQKSATKRNSARTGGEFTAIQQEQAEVILVARKLKNDLSKLAKYNHPKLYGRFSPVGAGTSRYSCKGSKEVPEYDNLQNTSRDFKSCFGLPDDSDMIIVAADFATLEIRIACAIMNEPNMYKALKEGVDIHRSTGSLIFNKPPEEITGRERSNSKVCNFGLTYAMGVDTFIQYAYDMYGIKYTRAGAKELVDKFFKAYPGLKAYHIKVGAALRKRNYICQTALGYKMKPKMYAEAINGPTQGTGSEIMRLAIHLLVKKDVKALKYIVNTVHDAAYLIVPEVDKLYWGKQLKEAMLEAWAEIMKSAEFHYHDIPMNIDVMYGKHMGDLEDDFAGGGSALSIQEQKELKK